LVLPAVRPGSDVVVIAITLQSVTTAVELTTPLPTSKPQLAMPASRDQWIRELQLEPHPEGGWYREVYRSAESIPRASLPQRFTGDRAFTTAIYYLLGANDFSALHRIRQDEVWHFYDGAPLAVDVIHPNCEAETLVLGRDLRAGQRPLAIVPAGSWFGASVLSPEGYCLVGCTVAPGFDFDDFEMADPAALIAAYPQHQELIERLTR
jgi:predicted cupin superfamily sugar epimerase